MKMLIYMGAIIGGIVGGFLPSLWGGNVLDLTSVIIGSVGTMTGAIVGYRICKYFDL